MLRAILRFPVKSMTGESLHRSSVGERGLDGDRGWAVVDTTTGLVGSAKHPHKWGDLLQLQAATTRDGHVCVTFPDGSMLTTEDLSDLDKRLGELLQRPVSMTRASQVTNPMFERTDPSPDDEATGSEELELTEAVTRSMATNAPAGSLFDYAPIHVVTASTLAMLDTAGAGTAEDARRFRPNLVLDLDGPGFQENDWPGKQIRIGRDVVLDIVMASPRCVVPTLPQAGLPKDVAALRSVATLNQIEIPGFGIKPCLGAYATVRHGGVLQVGDPTIVSPT